MIPFQHFMKLFDKESGKPTNAVIEDTVKLFERLRDGNAPGFQVLPVLNARLQMMRSQSASYLSHEYLNDNWQPLWHSEVAGLFAQAGLQFTASATISDNLLPDALPAKLRSLVSRRRTAACGRTCRISRSTRASGGTSSAVGNCNR